jgi:hypothetical protein
MIVWAGVESSDNLENREVYFGVLDKALRSTDETSSTSGQMKH